MQRKTYAVALTLGAIGLTARVAAADDGVGGGVGGVGVGNDDALVRAQISGGPVQAAPGLGASISGGWGGAHAQAIGDFTAEALLSGRLTIRAGVDYDAGKTRPSASASYTFYDARAHAVGVLAGIAYKPEGLTEPGGEFEGTVAISRVLGAGLASASVTYGQDADFHEHDGEAALSVVEPVARTVALGGITRMRDGLGSSTDLGARWDGLAGGMARFQIDTYQVTFVGGGEVIGAAAGGTKLGVLGTIAVGAWW
jgi:hypothetical protein